MRSLVLVLLVSLPASAQPTFPIPKAFPPDEKTLAEIKAKTAELEAAIAKVDDPSVKVFHKAAVWIVKHGEWYTEKSGQQTLDVLKAGLARAKAASEGKKPWLDARDKPIALGYQSEIDGSFQPFSVRYPDNFDPKKKYRLDVVLHGRDGTLTEVKFLHGKEFAKPGKGTDYFVIEVYGRGNNAYRWAGEEDIFEAMGAFADVKESVDIKRVVLRGFSMGGAGTWHFGLHHPFFAVMQPGAGFSATRGYHKGLEANPPEYITKGLHIYDAVDYAENCFNIPVVAYSGSKDPQKLAADNIENALKGFKEPHSFTHIVAPDLEHKQPPEWWAKCDAEIRKHLDAKGKIDRPERVRFVTYTVKYGLCAWVRVLGLDEHYKKAVVDAKEKNGTITATTENVRRLSFLLPPDVKECAAEIDGQAFRYKSGGELLKVGGKWTFNEHIVRNGNEKTDDAIGPIDDAFMWKFAVYAPTGKPWHDANHTFNEVTRTTFAATWDKFFRGTVQTRPAGPAPKGEVISRFNSVLFGDPQSNPEIARLLPEWPITWTKDKLVMNGVEYDAKTHIPMMIYPKSATNGGFGYAVLNSGHTFHKDALVGSNVLLYPRLGDWAVVKPKPTKDDPAAYEVVASGFFDEFWQFNKR
jgi:hypothetical protein